MPKKDARLVSRVDILLRLAETTGLPKTTCDAVVRGLVALINDCAVNREQVYLHGLGIFRTKDRKPREGRNMLTGEVIKVPAKVRLTFTPAKHLKDI